MNAWSAHVSVVHNDEPEEVNRAGPVAPRSAAAAPPSAKTEEAIELSPFVIVAENETGWVATNSLAGSRLNTSLKDIAASLEVLTKDFMDDFGLSTFEEVALYTTNVEGIREGYESTDGEGLAQGSGYPPPQRIRGLDSPTYRLLPQNGVDPVFAGLPLTARTANNWAVSALRSIQFRYYLDPARGDYSPRFPFDPYSPYVYSDSTGRQFTADPLNPGLANAAGQRLGASAGICWSAR